MIGRNSDSNFATVMDGISIKTLVHGESTLMTEFRLAGDSKLPGHSHPYEQTGYLVSGSITLYIKDEPFVMKPGDSWCIPSGVVHGADIHKDSVALEIFSPPRDDYKKYLCENEITRD